MIIAPPERIVFETPNDIVDYVSRGIPPTRNNFDKVIEVIRYPLSDEEVHDSTANDVVISRRIFSDINTDSAEFAEIIHRVYQNNVRNRNIAIASVIGAFCAGLLVAFNLCNDKK